MIHLNMYFWLHVIDAPGVMKKPVKVFQVRDVDFSIIKPPVQSAILTLET